MNLVEKDIMEKYLPELSGKWESMPDEFPAFLRKIPEEKKQQNEEYLNKNLSALKKVTGAANRKKMTEKQKEMLEQKVAALLAEETIISVHEAMDEKTMHEFQEGIREFLRKARAFMPELAMDGIGQAVRNYTVHAVFNELHGCKQACTPAIFGYSMLYPVTDNFIDDKQRSKEERSAYNQLIYDKIEGKEPQPSTEYGEKTCALLQCIEEQYGRGDDDTVYTLLLMMLDAQAKSMKQLHDKKTLSYEERLGVSLYKGGVSVLIDRFFVNCPMSREDYLFYLGFGFYLQLVDDLQDITEDFENGSQTLLTLDLSWEAEEKKVNRLFWFLKKIFDDYSFENVSMKEFLWNSCNSLIITAVLGSREHFNESYVNQLSDYLPLSPQAVQKLKADMEGNRSVIDPDSYLGMLDAMIA